MSTDPAPHLFWITSRAAGIAALLLTSLAVSVGLSMQTQLARRLGKPNMRVTHEALALASISMLLVHGLSLLGDGFLRFSIFDIAVPFLSSYRTVWTTIGIAGGWGLTLLGISYYARERIGRERWRVLHRFTALTWMLGLLHALGEGTDAGQIWFLAMVGIAGVPALMLLCLRLLGLRAAARSLDRAAG